MALVQIVFGLLSLAACGFYIVSVVAARKWARTPRTASSKAIPVSVLKPLKGDDPEQLANFRTFCHQNYPHYQIVFGALDPNDPGLKSAKRLKEEFPDVEIVIVEGGEVMGHNLKVSNLENLRCAARHELLVLCDSDMRVEPDYLQRVTAPFADPKVGLVTCPYRGYHARGLAAALESLGIGADFIPGVMSANMLEGMSFAFGSTIVLRSQTLEAIGGFRVLANELADDYLLGNLVHKQGLSVVLSDYVVDTTLGRETVGAMWSRRLRWARTARAMRPVGWAGSGVTHGTIWALCFAASMQFGAVGLAGLALVLLIRSSTVWLTTKNYTGDSTVIRWLPIIVLSDLLTFGLWVGSFTGSTVTWRGQRFRVRRGGTLEKLA